MLKAGSSVAARMLSFSICRQNESTVTLWVIDVASVIGQGIEHVREGNSHAKGPNSIKDLSVRRRTIATKLCL